MNPSLQITQNCLILDACCIINLYASGRLEDILKCIPVPVAVALYVKEEEALSIYCNEGSKERETLDLSQFIDRKLLHIVDIETVAESTRYLNYAAELDDDGEAITGAIAVERGWAIGTDDGAAIRFFNYQFPNTQILSTLHVIKYWAEVANIPRTELRLILQLIRIRGRYIPKVQHPLYSWWQDYYGK